MMPDCTISKTKIPHCALYQISDYSFFYQSLQLIWVQNKLSVNVMQINLNDHISMRINFRMPYNIKIKSKKSFSLNKMTEYPMDTHNFPYTKYSGETTSFSTLASNDPQRTCNFHEIIFCGKSRKACNSKNINGVLVTLASGILHK